MPSSSCLECSRSKKPCSGCTGVLALFRRRSRSRSRPRAPTSQQEQPPKPTLLRRAFGGMRNRRRRRHRASSFSSVRAVFWPLMSMGSDADRGDVALDRPRSSSTDSGGCGGDAVRAPSPSLDTPSASTTAARVLALQARLGEAESSLAASPTKPTSGTAAAGGLRGGSSSIGGAARAPSPLVDTPAASTTAQRVLALQARLSAAAALAPATKPSSKAGGGGLRSIGGACDDGDVEWACRAFERQLMEMLIEEGKVGDLMDVEELLCCWEKVRSPVFVRLVGRFYGELCMDLFSDVDPSEPIVS